MTTREPGTVDVGVLGATGMVGGLLVRMLAGHPWFRLREAGASAASAGHTLASRTPAGERDLLPPDASGLTLKPLDAEWDSPLLLSALPSGAAREMEPELAQRGHLVVSNASAFRQDAQVPLVIPEVNPDHLDLVRAQADRWSGGLVTNPNCVTAGLATALAPLHRAFGLDRVVVTTMQAISGAGRPGPAAGDLTDNVIPHISGEEDKIALESQKILGRLGEDGVRHGDFLVSTHANRVAVLHGHLMTVSLSCRTAPSPEEAAEVMAAFRGPEHVRALHSAPALPLEVLDGEARPQPRLDRDRGDGMTVTVGRIRACPVFHLRFLVLAHNLVRGAAGAALLNAELCHQAGLTERTDP